MVKDAGKLNARRRQRKKVRVRRREKPLPAMGTGVEEITTGRYGGSAGRVEGKRSKLLSKDVEGYSRAKLGAVDAKNTTP
jgi:hypothetical protein